MKMATMTFLEMSFVEMVLLALTCCNNDFSKSAVPESAPAITIEEKERDERFQSIDDYFKPFTTYLSCTIPDRINAERDKRIRLHTNVRDVYLENGVLVVLISDSVYGETLVYDPAQLLISVSKNDPVDIVCRVVNLKKVDDGKINITGLRLTMTVLEKDDGVCCR